MKRLIFALLATSSIAFALPAMAHPDHAAPSATAEQWNNGGANYADFDQEYQHIWQEIQHGLGDGAYTRPQVQQYMRTMQDIRHRAEAMEREGRYDPQDTQARLQRLHETMHDAHAEGHASQERAQTGDEWNNGGATYTDFNQEYQHIWQDIQHGLSDGSYTRWQAQGYYRTVQKIRSRATYMERQGRYGSSDTQASLQRLHEAMHAVHERSHESQNGYQDNRYPR
jgi:hypothetical protein